MTAALGTWVPEKLSKAWCTAVTAYALSHVTKQAWLPRWVLVTFNDLKQRKPIIRGYTDLAAVGLFAQYQAHLSFPLWSCIGR